MSLKKIETKAFNYGIWTLHVILEPRKITSKVNSKFCLVLVRYDNVK